MSGGGGKGDQKSTERVELPPEFKPYALHNIREMEAISDIGYIPYQGPVVSAFTPVEQQALAGQVGLADQMLYGTAAGPGSAAYQETLAQMPEAQDFGGVQGYSAYDMYLAELERMAPGQRWMMESFSIDPETGGARQYAHTGVGGQPPPGFAPGYTLWPVGTEYGEITPYVAPPRGGRGQVGTAPGPYDPLTNTPRNR